MHDVTDFLKLTLLLIGIGVAALGIFIAVEPKQWQLLREEWPHVEADVRDYVSTYNVDKNGCVDRALEKMDECGGEGMACIFISQEWLTACLEKAGEAAEFCSNVPSEGNMEHGVRWRNSTCTAKGRASRRQPCQRLLVAWQGYCNP